MICPHILDPLLMQLATDLSTRSNPTKQRGKNGIPNRFNSFKY